MHTAGRCVARGTATYTHTHTRKHTHTHTHTHLPGHGDGELPLGVALEHLYCLPKLELRAKKESPTHTHKVQMRLCSHLMMVHTLCWRATTQRRAWTQAQTQTRAQPPPRKHRHTNTHTQTHTRKHRHTQTHTRKHTHTWRVATHIIVPGAPIRQLEHHLDAALELCRDAVLPYPVQHITTVVRRGGDNVSHPYTVLAHTHTHPPTHRPTHERAST
jgi:hypothetical protein